MVVGAYIIFINVVLIIYFAFREGIIGGFIATSISILYYFFIIYTRHYRGQQYISGVETTAILSLLYFFLAFIIGWLRQRIDQLIDIQADERKRLETIIQQLPIGALITDSTGKVTHINKQVYNILGLKIPIGFLMGRDTLKGVKINGKKIIPEQSPSYKALASGKIIASHEIIFEQKNGKEFFLQVNSAPVYNSKKKIIAVATLVRDITRQRELEQQKDNFIAMASHELKTPLTSTKLFTQVLRNRLFELGDTDAMHYLNKMDDQLNQLTTIVSDLLDISRIQQNKLTTKREQFSLEEIAQRTVEQLQPVVQQKLILNWHTHVRFTGDKEKIEQVFINFITNAAKYSPPDSQIILFLKKEGNSVKVGIRDFGIGIPKEEQGKIFERFYQAKRAKTYPGLGLGLYISSEIIKAHGGKMWVQSIEGKGSTFYFCLPLHTHEKGLSKKIRI